MELPTPRDSDRSRLQLPYRGRPAELYRADIFDHPRLSARRQRARAAVSESCAARAGAEVDQGNAFDYLGRPRCIGAPSSITQLECPHPFRRTGHGVSISALQRQGGGQPQQSGTRPGKWVAYDLRRMDLVYRGKAGVIDSVAAHTTPHMRVVDRDRSGPTMTRATSRDRHGRVESAVPLPRGELVDDGASRCCTCWIGGRCSGRARTCRRAHLRVGERRTIGRARRSSRVRNGKVEEPYQKRSSDRLRAAGQDAP